MLRRGVVLEDCAALVIYSAKYSLHNETNSVSHIFLPPEQNSSSGHEAIEHSFCK
jgi:hypothetical protein